MSAKLNATFPIAAALLAASAHSMAFDSLQAGFDRMLAREPAAAHAVAAPAAPADPLQAAVVRPLRDGVWPARTQAADPVAESFARMLQHEPSRHVPPLPAGAGTDPLIAAVAQPLLRANHVQTTAVAAYQRQR